MEAHRERREIIVHPEHLSAGAHYPVGTPLFGRVSEPVLSLTANDDQYRATLDLQAVCQDNAPRLRRIAAGMGLSGANADDALQDSFAALLGSGVGFADQAAAAAWLTRVLINRVRLHHRQTQRGLRAVTGWGAALARRAPGARRAAPENLPADDEVQAIHDCLRGLPENELIVLVLRYFEGMNATQIGALLALPAATVRTRLHAARLRMAARLTTPRDGGGESTR